MEPARHRRNGIRTILTVPWVSGVLVAVLLIASFFEQRQLLEQFGSADRLIWLAIFSAAAGLMLAISTTVPRPADASLRRARLPAPLKLARRILWSASLCFAAISSWLVHSRGAPTFATVAWLLGITLIIAAANDIAVSRGTNEPLRQAHSKHVIFALILLGIMIVAAILRVPGLETLPGYVHNDEAANGLMARSIVAGEVPSLFRNGWASLPILGYVWEALFLKLFGDSLTSLRLASAVVGIGSIALVALLGKELFNVRTGLIAAALVTFFHMHIHFSRVGHHYMQALFCLMFTLYLLVRALRYGQPLAAVGTGILLSVDVQVYFAARIAYVIVPLVVIYELLIVGRHLLRSRLSTVGWIISGWIVGVAPIATFIASDWSEFMTRSRQVFVLGDTTQGHVYDVYGTHDALIILKNQLWLVLQTFNVGGDTSLQYGSPYPMLDTVDGALLPAAVAYALLNANRTGFVICLIALTSALVAGGVFTIDAPFWPRLIVVLPFLALLLAALLDAIWQLLHRAAMPPTLRVLLAVGFLIVIARENYQWYFTQFATQIRADILAAPMDVGNYLRRVDGYPAVYGITDGKELYASHEGIRFLAPRAQICDVLEGISTENCKSSVTLPSEQIFLLMPGRESLLESLKRTYPGGAVRKLWSYDNDLKIIAYRVPL